MSNLKVFDTVSVAMLLLESLWFLLSTQTVLLLCTLASLTSYQLLSTSHFYALTLQCLLTHLVFVIIMNYDVQVVRVVTEVSSSSSQSRPEAYASDALQPRLIAQH
jgi:hypothetical protein